MKFLKYALLVLGGLVVLTGAVLGYIAATFNPNQYKPQIVQAVKDKTQRTLKLDGDIALSFWPSIGARVGKTSLSERASEKVFAAVEEAHISLKLLPLLSKQAVVDTVRIKGLRANIVKAKDGKTNVDDFTGTPPAKGAPAAKGAKVDFRPDVAGVEIVDAAITYLDQAAGSKYQLSKLNLKTGRIVPGVPTQIEFSAHVQGDQPKLDLPVSLATRLTFDSGTESATLDNLVLEAKGTAAGLTNLAFRLTGSAAVEGEKERARAELAGKVVDSSIKARLEVAGFATPTFHFDVDIDQFDVDRYLPHQAGSGQPAGAHQQPGKEVPFDLSGLRNLRAAGTLKVGAFKANNVKASNLRMDIKANGGRVEVNPLTAGFYQGSLSSAVTVNAAPTTPTFAARHNMSGINVGAFLKDLANNDTLEGKGNVTADVTAHGNTVAALKKALNGSASVKLADGAVKGIDIAGSIRNAKAKLGALTGEQTQQADRNQKTGFSELTATFNIKNGVARNNDLSLKSPLLRVGGEGEINIGDDTLNYLVRASIVGTSQGQGGRDVADLKGVTVPVRVAGPLALPSYKLDFSSMATDTAKQTAIDALQKQLGGGAKSAPATSDAAKQDAAKSGDSSRDKLRSILGR